MEADLRRVPHQQTIEELGSQRLTLFALAWGVQTLLEMGKWGEMFANPLLFLVFASACLVCLRPGEPIRLAWLASLQVMAAMHKLPWLTNHTLVNTVANLTLLACLLSVWGARRLAIGVSSTTTDVKVDWAQEWYARFAPLLRTELVIVYSLATFHKLNTDWFHPEQSCAVIFWERIVRLTPWPEALRPLAGIMPYVVLVIEGLIPLLLARPRWRMAGIGLGLCFHLPLGLIGFFRFSAIVTSLYCLFLPDWVFDAAADAGMKWRQRWTWGARCLDRLCSPSFRQALSVLVVLVAALALFRLSMEPQRAPLVLVRQSLHDSRGGWSVLFQGIWLGATVGVIGILTSLVWRYRPAPDRSVPAPRLGWLWIFPVFTALNGAGPYLGLKTEASFSMFSNLRTIGATSNHLLIHIPLALLSEGTDLVRIVATTDSELDRLREFNQQLPWIELCSYVEARLAKRQDFELTLERGGKVREFASVEASQSEFAQPPSWLRKLTWFRPVSFEAVCPCSH
jgi:hypothetical protein